MATMKQYIISFQATLQGHKMVLTALKGMERQVKGVTATTKAGGKATKTYGQQMGELAKRALMVIPVWLVLRAAMMTVMRTFGDMIRGFIDLDDQLARIRTVMHGTAKDIDAQMTVIRTRILDVAKDSRIPIKELAEGFYFLKTANLDATEATAAFAHVTNLAIGTANSMAESARAVAGIYNTMGKYLGDNLTVHEKFQKIADVLAFTYSTQDVQLSELIQSYTKLAPYVTGLSDNFTELTTMLGFLNTRLLRGGRTGRLTGRAILQLTKNAKKLAQQLDITFDPDKPIAFLDTIRMIREKLGIVGKITAEQGQIIQDVFATRAGVTIRLLIEHFDELEEQIQDAVEGADGFAEKMKEIRMGTIAGQMARMKNIMVILNTEFLTAYTGTTKLADAIKVMGDNLLALTAPIRAVGTGLGWLVEMAGDTHQWISDINAQAEQLQSLRRAGVRPDIISALEREFRKGGAPKIDWGFDEALREEREQNKKDLERIKEIEGEILDLRKKRVEVAQKEERGLESEKAVKIEKEIKKLQEEMLELSSDEVKLQHEQNKLTEVENKLKDKGLSLLDKEIQKDKSRIRMMKIMGASTLDIAKAELEIAETAQLSIEPRKEQLELLRAQYKVTEETAKYHQQITDVFLKAEVDLLKAVGGSETQLLELREKQIRVQAVSKGVEWEQLQLLNLRIQQQQVLLREKAREVKVARGLALSYEKADMFQKGKIRRAIELTQLTEDELAGRFRQDAYDKAVILEYWSSFSKTAQEAITKAIWEMNRLPGEAPKLEAKDLLPKDEIVTYWQEWIRQGKQAGDVVNANFRAGLILEIGKFGVPIPVGAGAPTGGLPTGGITPILPTPTPKLPEWMAAQAPSRFATGGAYTAVTKEGQTYMADTLERLERMVEREGLILDRLESIEEAIINGNLDQTTIQKRIDNNLRSY